MPTDPDPAAGNRVHDYVQKVLEQELVEATGRSREELVELYASGGLTQQQAEAHVDLLMKDLAERQAQEQRESEFVRSAASSRAQLEADLRGLGMERFRRIYAERRVKVDVAGGSEG